MLAARIDRLPPAQKGLLPTLAALGKECTPSAARAVAGRFTEGCDTVDPNEAKARLEEFR